MAFGISYGLPFSGRYFRVNSETQAFIDATGITDSQQIYAVNQLVEYLQDNNLWDKMEAVYPLVGGTADRHKYNLKDPRDLDAAYRITWTVSGVTHNANGITGNELSGAANTNYLITRLNDQHIACYIRNNAQSRAVMGALGSLGNRFTQIYPRQSGGAANVFEAEINQSTSTSVSNVTDSKGFTMVTRIASNSLKAILRGTLIIDSTQASASPVPDRTLALLAKKTATFSDFSSFNMAFASIGFGLTETESATLRTGVIAYETVLGRNV